MNTYFHQIKLLISIAKAKTIFLESVIEGDIIPSPSSLELKSHHKAMIEQCVTYYSDLAPELSMKLERLKSDLNELSSVHLSNALDASLLLERIQISLSELTSVLNTTSNLAQRNEALSREASFGL